MNGTASGGVRWQRVRPSDPSLSGSSAGARRSAGRQPQLKCQTVPTVALWAVKPDTVGVALSSP